MDWVEKPQNYMDLYGIFKLLRSSLLNNFPLKTIKLGWVAFHSEVVQLKCLDFQFNQYKKLVPVLSRFCNWLLRESFQMQMKFISLLPPLQYKTENTNIVYFHFSSSYWKLYSYQK